VPQSVNSSQAFRPPQEQSHQLLALERRQMSVEILEPAGQSSRQCPKPFVDANGYSAK
jgi:hypothetical protein